MVNVHSRDEGKIRMNLYIESGFLPMILGFWISDGQEELLLNNLSRYTMSYISL